MGIPHSVNRLLQVTLAEWELNPYRSLAAEINKPLHTRVTGEDGQEYRVEVNVFWDNVPGGRIRVMVAVDGGGWRAMVPYTDSLLIEPPDR